MSKDFFSTFRKDLSIEKENFEIRKIINLYVDDAKRKGIDLSKYNTFQSANDVNTITVLLSNLSEQNPIGHCPKTPEIVDINNKIEVSSKEKFAFVA